MVGYCGIIMDYMITMGLLWDYYVQNHPFFVDD